MLDFKRKNRGKSLPESLQKFNLNLESSEVTECGVQDLMQSLPESLQQFDLIPYFRHWEEEFASTLTCLHLNLPSTQMTNSGVHA